MGNQRWTDKRFGQRVKAGRNHRRWSQAEMAKMLSDRGIHLGPSAVAKIEAGDRSVKIDEAAGIADIFEISLDSLLGRPSATRRRETTDRLRALLNVAEQSRQQVWTITEAIRDHLAELPVEFDGAEALHKLGDSALSTNLVRSEEALVKLVIAAQIFLQREMEKLEAAGQVEVPQDGASQS